MSEQAQPHQGEASARETALDVVKGLEGAYAASSEPPSEIAVQVRDAVVLDKVELAGYGVDHRLPGVHRVFVAVSPYPPPQRVVERGDLLAVEHPPGDTRFSLLDPWVRPTVGA